MLRVFYYEILKENAFKRLTPLEKLLDREFFFYTVYKAFREEDLSYVLSLRLKILEQVHMILGDSLQNIQKFAGIVNALLLKTGYITPIKVSNGLFRKTFDIQFLPFYVHERILKKKLK